MPLGATLREVVLSLSLPGFHQTAGIRIVECWIQASGLSFNSLCALSSGSQVLPTKIWPRWRLSCLAPTFPFPRVTSCCVLAMRCISYTSCMSTTSPRAVARAIANSTKLSKESLACTYADGRLTAALSSLCSLTILFTRKGGRDQINAFIILAVMAQGRLRTAFSLPQHFVWNQSMILSSINHR